MEKIKKEGGKGNGVNKDKYDENNRRALDLLWLRSKLRSVESKKIFDKLYFPQEEKVEDK